VAAGAGGVSDRGEQAAPLASTASAAAPAARRTVLFIFFSLPSA
jgi:hypothetical protein